MLPADASRTIRSRPNIHNITKHNSPLRPLLVPLKEQLPNPTILDEEDEADSVLAVAYAVLSRANNRAMSIKELGEAAYTQGLLRTRYGVLARKTHC